MIHYESEQVRDLSPSHRSRLSYVRGLETVSSGYELSCIADCTSPNRMKVGLSPLPGKHARRASRGLGGVVVYETGDTFPI